VGGAVVKCAPDDQSGVDGDRFLPLISRPSVHFDPGRGQSTPGNSFPRLFQTSGSFKVCHIPLRLHYQRDLQLYSFYKY